MPIKRFKPTSPGRRQYETADFKDLTKGKKPERALTKFRKQNAGRNNTGRITVRFRGGGHRRRYRIRYGDGLRGGTCIERGIGRRPGHRRDPDRKRPEIIRRR